MGSHSLQKSTGGRALRLSESLKSWRACSWYSLNSGVVACFSAHARPLMVWLCGPPCSSGTTSTHLHSACLCHAFVCAMHYVCHYGFCKYGF